MEASVSTVSTEATELKIELSPEQLLELFWCVEGCSEHHIGFAQEFYVAAHRGTRAVRNVIRHLLGEIEEAQRLKDSKNRKRTDWRKQYEPKRRKKGANDNQDVQAPDDGD
jgi:hypothetical protein